MYCLVCVLVGLFTDLFVYRLVLVQIGLCTGWLLYILVCVQNDYVLGVCAHMVYVRIDLFPLHYLYHNISISSIDTCTGCYNVFI